MNPSQVNRARADTPACEKVAHLNNAGAALMPQCVVETQRDYLERESELGGYEAAAEVKSHLERVYDSIARLLGADSSEIALIENATRAWDMAFYSVDFKPQDRILTGEAEYASNYIALLQVCKRTGAKLEVIPSDEHGQLDVEALERAMDERVKLISLTHVPTSGGLVNPALKVGRVARAWDCLYLLDACQSAGQMPLDVQALGCDFLSVTGRKYLRGPRGTGFLYARRKSTHVLEPILLDLHAADWLSDKEYRVREDARKFENWESNVGARLGLGRAVDYALEWGLEAIQSRVYGLAATLRNLLHDLPGVIVRDLGREQCGIVTFTVAGRSAEEVQRKLSRNSINTSVSVQKYAVLDLGARGLDAVVRASVHYYNTEAELERLCHTLSELIRDKA